MSGGPGHYSDPHSIVEEHYQDIHRQVIIIMMMMIMTMIMMISTARLTSSSRARPSWSPTGRSRHSGPTPSDPKTG